MSGTVGETTLTVEQLATHSHATSLGASKRINWGNNGAIPYLEPGSLSTGSIGGSQSHTHTLDGASGEATSLPPYYALSYIMRTA